MKTIFRLYKTSAEDATFIREHVYDGLIIPSIGTILSFQDDLGEVHDYKVIRVVLDFYAKQCRVYANSV